MIHPFQWLVTRWRMMANQKLHNSLEKLDLQPPQEKGLELYAGKCRMNQMRLRLLLRPCLHSFRMDLLNPRNQLQRLPYSKRTMWHSGRNIMTQTCCIPLQWQTPPKSNQL